VQDRLRIRVRESCAGPSGEWSPCRFSPYRHDPERHARRLDQEQRGRWRQRTWKAGSANSSNEKDGKTVYTTDVTAAIFTRVHPRCEAKEDTDDNDE
jgi:hypothetical protein